MRSGKRLSLGVAGAIVATGLTGCVTTQEKNTWLLLRNARTLASEGSVRVRVDDPSVRVGRVDFVGGRGGSALVVPITNRGSRPLSDLPISVGVTGAHGTRSYLNGRANSSYWDSHVSAIGPGETISWVLPYSGKALAGRPFALVGTPTQPLSTTVARLPEITTAELRSESTSRLEIRLSNGSGLPQYGLQVYAVALRHGTAVGAGRTALTELAASSKATVGLRLAGDPAGARLRLYAPPTIFK